LGRQALGQEHHRQALGLEQDRGWAGQLALVVFGLVVFLLSDSFLYLYVNTYILSRYSFSLSETNNHQYPHDH
jgi:hypothetical protein